MRRDNSLYGINAPQLAAGFFTNFSAFCVQFFGVTTVKSTVEIRAQPFSEYRLLVALKDKVNN
jgi:hypothetical protein